ncbi:hypothetical protein, partial [Streptomyces sp. SID8373]
MHDGTSAGQNLIPQASIDDLTAVFADHSARLTRWVYNRLDWADRADWHLAEDIAQEAALRLVAEYIGRRIESPRALLETLAREAITTHYRPVSGEDVTDFGDRVEETRLPAATSAEDVALTHLTVLTMVADPAAPLG